MATKKNFSEKVITKRFINMVAKFNNDLNAFAEYCGEEKAILYEDILTSFTLSNVRIEGFYMVYEFDGREDKDILFRFGDGVKEGEEEEAFNEGHYYNWVEEAKEQIKFWRACIRRAKKYWQMSADSIYIGALASSSARLAKISASSAKSAAASLNLNVSHSAKLENSGAAASAS